MLKRRSVVPKRCRYRRQCKRGLPDLLSPGRDTGSAGEVSLYSFQDVPDKPGLGVYPEVHAPGCGLRPREFLQERYIRWDLGLQQKPATVLSKVDIHGIHQLRRQPSVRVLDVGAIRGEDDGCMPPEVS